MKRSALMLAAAVAASGAAWADAPLWEAGIGVAGLRLPHYRGSNQTDSWALPLPYFVYRGDVLRADRDGARAILFESKRLDFDLSFAASPPTRSDKNIARQGMPDLAPTFEVGPKLNVNLASGAGWKVDLRMPLRAAITLESKPRAVGWSFEPVLNLDYDVNRWHIGMQTGPLWGDRKLHAYIYDVAAPYATSARPAYAAGAGFGGWQATLALSRRFESSWAGVFVRADSLAGASFEESPLVRSRHSLAFGAAFSWIFATSEQRVSGRD